MRDPFAPGGPDGPPIMPNDNLGPNRARPGFAERLGSVFAVLLATLLGAIVALGLIWIIIKLVVSIDSMIS